VQVISNHPDLQKEVASFDVPYAHIPVTKDTKPEAERQQAELIAGRADLVVLARYMQVLSGDFLERIGVPAINIHHSFLPAFAGAGPYEQELGRLSTHLPNVRFVGMLDERELARLFRGALAVVVPSLAFETFGYVALESFAVETPVIARRAGALVEVVEESGGGLLFENTDELVDSIRRLVDDPALRRELGRRGRDAVETTWSERVQVDEYLHLVRAVAGERVSANGRASSAVPVAEA
jgi:glycosyltransferase involved in cell wall biosynthesis